MGWLVRERKPERRHLVVRIMTIINLAAAMAVLLSWSDTPAVFADPLYRVTGATPSNHPSLIEYPAALLWAVPLCAVCTAYLARSLGKVTMARSASVFPALLAAASAAWLYYSGHLLQ